jgi:8-oxo-dGTP pyrophosphatase MutT (NUDIX family)
VGGDFVLGLPAGREPEETYRALVAAAVRETVEEAGVLLAITAQGPATVAQADAVRRALLDGTPWAQALSQIGAEIPFSALVAVSHWMTPAVEIRRFDTRFFAAVLPAGQRAHSASGETAEAGWVRPAEMLRRAAASEVVMLPPTVAALQALAAAPDAGAVLNVGHRPNLRPVLPHPYRRGSDVSWRLVDGYTGEPLDQR